MYKLHFSGFSSRNPYDQAYATVFATIHDNKKSTILCFSFLTSSFSPRIFNGRRFAIYNMLYYLY